MPLFYIKFSRCIFTPLLYHIAGIFANFGTFFRCGELVKQDAFNIGKHCCLGIFCELNFDGTSVYIDCFCIFLHGLPPAWSCSCFMVCRLTTLILNDQFREFGILPRYNRSGETTKTVLNLPFAWSRRSFFNAGRSKSFPAKPQSAYHFVTVRPLRFA